MNGHKVYTVVWFDREGKRKEVSYDDHYEAENLLIALFAEIAWIEEDWLEPDVSY